MTYTVSDQTLAYNAKDAFITLECADEYLEDLDKPSYPGGPTFRETYEHTVALYEPLMYMQSRGIRVDTEALETEKFRIEHRMVELQEQINKLCGRDINPNSPKQLQEYFYVSKGIPPYTKLNQRKERVITCDDKALQRIARGTSVRPGLPEASLIQEYKGLSKLKGTYLEITLDADKRIRCSYNPRGTRFGRVSSSKTVFGTGMNMQNLDPRFQSFLATDPGCLFLSLDKRQAEWVVVAYCSGDESMISAVERGEDVHVYTAHRMFGQPIDVIKREEKILGHTSDPDEIKKGRVGIPELIVAMADNSWLPRTMSMRQCGKKSNHGLNYDERYKMFALINEITEKEAKVIVDFYHRTYPGIRRWYEQIKRELSDQGRVLTNLFGRPCRFLGRWDDNLWKAAYSFKPQSTVGELVNRAIVEIYNSRDETLRHLEILQQVHDNILFQLPREEPKIGDAVHRLRKYMEPTLNADGREFVIGTDLKIGFNMRDMVEVPIDDDPQKLTQDIRKAAWRLEKQGTGLAPI